MASPRNSKDYSDSTQTPMDWTGTGLGLGMQICRPLAGGLVQSESEWSLIVQLESNRSPIGKVGECKDLKIVVKLFCCYFASTSTSWPEPHLLPSYAYTYISCPYYMAPHVVRYIE
jgi:hypothetical protein